MKQKRSLKQRLIATALTLVMLVSSLLGTTFAWFTDSVTSAGNTIQAGNLEIDLFHKVGNDWVSLKQNPDHKIFDHDAWEPGYTGVETLKISNLGSLALQYRLSVEVEYGTAKLGDNGEKLADVIEVYVTDGESNETSFSAVKSTWTYKGTLSEVMKNPSTFLGGELLPTGKVLDATSAPTTAVANKTVSIAFHMQESAGNGYQNLSVGNVFVNLIATQLSYEGDSFGNNYDKDTVFPELNVGGITVDVTTANNVVTQDTTVSGVGVAATIPSGVVVEDGVSKLGLSVTEKTQSEANLTLNEGEALRSLDVHMEGVAANNTQPMLITIEKAMKVGLNIGNYTLYHVEGGVSNAMTVVNTLAELDAHNEFFYDPATGNVTLAMATFSEVALVADTENAWEGKYDYTWYDASKTELTIANADQLAAFGAIVGGMAEGIEQDSFLGKTVKLIADINLGDAEAKNNPNLIFYPIGYNSSDGKYEKTGVAVTTGFYNFSGTFDGNGNKISNFYHNTWEMKGDNNYYDATLQYYRDGMGLFGRVYGGTVKNLTVDNFSSDGEYTTTGVIAAYADGATFENIAITNCNPRVYNIGNGGIVGCVGWYAKEANLKTTFKNITVDNSNKISALWGSYDVACGGIVGQYYPTSGQTSAGTPANGGVHFENCHVAAQMDVYNDVCANYQYYAYRYAGMLIGSVRENVTVDGHSYPKMDGIKAEGCTVHFGTWNDYYYCEFEKNGHPSYSGPDDYKFSRVPNSEIDTSNGKENATCIGHNHTEVEDNQAVYLPFNNLVTGYGWGVTTKVVGELEGVTILDRVVADSVVKFETKFTGDFRYRVGNLNSVSLDSLFGAITWDKEKHGTALKDSDGKVLIVDSSVWVKIEKVNENSNVSGTFTANTTDWTKGTILFSGTGVVKVTIQDYNFCTPTVLYLEVVDAVNATGATNATSNNVVLLNDAGFSSLEVSGGYTLYGNGFTLTCGSDSAALDMGYAFVTLDNGTLDNVQIVCPNFDYAVLYKSNMTESGNRSETTDKTRYYNVKSGVMVSGNSQILNSRISGARAAVNVAGGNVVIDNSRIELGAVASLLVGSANSVTLRDVTLVQKPTASTYDPSKTLMGFSVLCICDANGDSAPITIEGTLVQNAWVDEEAKKYVPSAGQSIISTVLGKTDYLHDIDGDGTKESLNLGFAYMPESATSKVNATTITDNRTNKNDAPYDYAEISIFNGKTYVYSYKNTNGTEDNFKTESAYAPNMQGDIITVNYSDVNENRILDKVYGAGGWVYQLSVDLDQGAYTFDFSKLTVLKNGTAVPINRSDKVSVEEGTTEYTLTLEDGSTILFKLIGTATTKDAPQWSSDVNGSALSTTMNASWEAGLCVASSKGGTWSGAAPALQNVYIRYYSTEAKAYKVIHLADYTPSVTGKVNGSNTTCTITGPDFTLTLTGGQVHSSNKVSAIPVVCNGKLYFVAATSSGLVNSGNSARSVPVSYSFTDGFGNTLTGSHTWSVAEDQNNEYKYSDFCNGTPTKLESSSGGGSSCVTPDTLITLADGTLVRVDSLTGNEELLVWNMETGMLDKAPIMFVDSDAEAEYEIIKLYFSDGTEVKVIYEHGFWDYDLNKYVYLDENAADYIGHTFAKQNGDSLEKVTLVDVVIETELTTAWSPVTVGHLCYFVNGMLSMPGGVGGLFNIFEVDPETMTYDYEQIEKDIATYGLFTYEELNAICPLSEEMFNAAGGAYLKISIGKGNLTIDELIAMINRYSIYI